MDFQTLKNKLPDSTGQTFLTYVRNESIEDADFFNFQANAESNFLQAIEFLASPETFSKADLEKLQEKNFLLLAQTIDGDYIACTDEAVLVLPISLYKTDIENFNLSAIDFFIEFENGKLQSSILPSVNK